MSATPENANCLVVYSNYAYRGTPQTDLLLLAESVRAFGGSTRDWPIWIMCDDLSRLSASTLRRASGLRVSILPFAIDQAFSTYPFAAKASAAAEAERIAEGFVDQLLWFDRDSLVVGDISSLLLTHDKKCSFRPVNVKNIGLDAGVSRKVDPFWSRVFELSGVDESDIGTAISYIDRRNLRFYIAAGLVGARVELGIFQEWERFMRGFVSDDTLRALCAESEPHRIFLHQAALSLAVAHTTHPNERQELPILSMYPLNFWEEDGPERRPRMLDDAISLRYDTELDGDAWCRFPMSEALERWIRTHMHADE